MNLNRGKNFKLVNNNFKTNCVNQNGGCGCSEYRLKGGCGCSNSTIYQIPNNISMDKKQPVNNNLVGGCGCSEYRQKGGCGCSGSTNYDYDTKILGGGYGCSSKPFNYKQKRYYLKKYEN